MCPEMVVSVSSSRYGYDIVRYKTEAMVKYAEALGRPVEHYVILHLGEPVGAITNEHVEGNWRVITQDGRQIGPGDKYDSQVEWGEVLNFIFNQPVSVFLDKRVYIKVTTEMGFIRYADNEYGSWRMSGTIVFHDRKNIDLHKIMKDLETTYTHPMGDMVKKIEIVPVR